MAAMTTRREFIHSTLTSLIAAGAGSLPLAASQSGTTTGRHPLNAPVGLQLYSLRHLFAKGDVPGTLAMVRRWGIEHVELAGFYGMSAEQFTPVLRKAGLRAASIGADYNQLRENADQVIADARTVGASHVMTAWIPHEGAFSRPVADAAVTHFNAWGRKLKDAGLRFSYHVHGYEFQPGPDGTLFDVIAKNTDPSVVSFEMDVFWVVRGGGDPAGLFRTYPGRFPLTHLKDIRKGTTLGDPTGSAPDDTCVPLGEGMVDWPAVLGEANRQDIKYHFIEDEHPESEKQIPLSLKYLAGLTL
jgi:sugar phosphate isomerase/epimerase